MNGTMELIRAGASLALLGGAPVLGWHLLRLWIQW